MVGWLPKFIRGQVEEIHHFLKKKKKKIIIKRSIFLFKRTTFYKKYRKNFKIYIIMDSQVSKINLYLKKMYYIYWSIFFKIFYKKTFVYLTNFKPGLVMGKRWDLYFFFQIFYYENLFLSGNVEFGPFFAKLWAFKIK